ncbi:MAG: thioredoxin [Firmicutes bacterium]|nr:thioredoxin [Bacillota bacterium]
MAEITLTAVNFEQEVLKSDLPVLVDFWATWCGPCRMLGPVIAQIAEEKAGVLKVGKVNVDEQPQLAARFGIASIPTVMLFRDGQAAATAVGARPKSQLLSALGLE